MVMVVARGLWALVTVINEVGPLCHQHSPFSTLHCSGPVSRFSVSGFQITTLSTLCSIGPALFIYSWFYPGHFINFYNKQDFNDFTFWCGHSERVPKKEYIDFVFIFITQTCDVNIFITTSNTCRPQRRSPVERLRPQRVKEVIIIITNIKCWQCNILSL